MSYFVTCTRKGKRLCIVLVANQTKLMSQEFNPVLEASLFKCSSLHQLVQEAVPFWAGLKSEQTFLWLTGRTPEVMVFLRQDEFLWCSCCCNESKRCVDAHRALSQIKTSSLAQIPTRFVHISLLPTVVKIQMDKIPNQRQYCFCVKSVQNTSQPFCAWWTNSWGVMCLERLKFNQTCLLPQLRMPPTVWQPSLKQVWNLSQPQ